MLAYYVEYHMRKSLVPLLFQDEELYERRKTRDPVKPAKPSASAKRKKGVRLTSTGFKIHSFQTLLAELATRSLTAVESSLIQPGLHSISSLNRLLSRKRLFNS